MGSYVSLCILMDSNWCLCVPIGPPSFLGILMCLYVSLWVFIGPYSSLWTVMGPIGSLSVVMRRYGS